MKSDCRQLTRKSGSVNPAEIEIGRPAMNARALAVMMSACCLLLSSCGIEEAVEGNLATMQKSEPLGNEELLEAEIDLPVGTLEIEAGPASNLYECELEYNERAFSPELDVHRRGNTAVLHFRLNGEGKGTRRMGKTRLTLRLNPSVPVVLRTKNGVGESRIDLENLRVRELRIENGVGETQVSMLSPNQTTCERVDISNGVGALKMTGLGNLAFRQLRFQGGVGGSELDFSGEWREEGEINIDVGVGGVELTVPRSVGAEVQASKSFLSGVNLPDFEKRGDTYISNNMERVNKVIRLRVNAGIGGVDLKWL